MPGRGSTYLLRPPITTYRHLPISFSRSSILVSAFYLEYSNETWNTSFSQSAYIEAQGLALGFSTDPVLNGADYTAYRSVQIFNIFQNVVGSSGRMIRVIASQAENSWLSNQTLQFQNAFASADVLAIAPYFNCSDTSTGGFGVLGDPSTADQVAAMSVDQVDAIQLAHINNCVLQEIQSNAAVASSYGLKMVGYEGGQSLVGFNGARKTTRALTALFGAVNRGPGMEALYNKYFQNWVNCRRRHVRPLQRYGRIHKVREFRSLSNIRTRTRPHLQSTQPS